MDSLKLKVDSRGVAVLTFSRPQQRNALSFADQEAFATAVDNLMAAPPRVLILTGQGSAFVSGGDLAELRARTTADDGRRLNEIMSGALRRLTELPCPVIAAVNGDAAGGGVEILTACDLRVAAPTARLHFAQVRIGLTSGWGGLGRLIFLLGQSRATDLMLTGRTLSAEEATQVGLIHRLAEPDEPALKAAQRWADELVALPFRALEGMKRLLWFGVVDWLHEISREESRLFVQLYGGPDHREALTAFAEKRAPHFHPPP